MSRQVSSARIPIFSCGNTSLDDYPLLGALVHIWRHAACCFLQERIHNKCLRILLGSLSVFGRRTISRGICARAEQFQDWTSTYRFFSKDRWSALTLQHQVLLRSTENLPMESAVVVAIDATHARKAGKKIPGAGLFYDPTSPPYARSYCKALRFTSVTLLVTPNGSLGPAVGIPIRLELSPTITKPKKRDPQESHQNYKALSRIWTLSTIGAEQIGLLRAEMDAEPRLRHRRLVVAADGGYCNKAVLSAIPERTVLVTRTRKDTKLFALPEESAPGAKGRKKIYGDPLPTPEEIRRDESYPWRTSVIFAAGKWHNLRYKTVANVLWKPAGNRRMRLMVIEPLRYRPTATSELLYRNPAYLLVTDPTYPVQSALQNYFHRTEIEVNHRDLKDALGLGDAQVWSRESVPRQSAFCAIAYSWLQMAALSAYGPDRGNQYLPHPKWRNDMRSRPSVQDLIARLRLELWAYESGLNISPISRGSRRNMKPQEYAKLSQQWLLEVSEICKSPPMTSSVLYSSA